MVLRVQESSSDQRATIEEFPGRPILDEDATSVRPLNPSPAPKWLQESWESAQWGGVERLSMEEIDAEIVAARRGISVVPPYKLQDAQQ